MLKPSKDCVAHDLHALDKLPAETFELVAKQCDSHSLLALRRTSRECCAKVVRVYGNVWFAEGSALVHDERSLNRLLQTVRHPLAGPFLRKVKLYMDIWAESAGRPYGHKTAREQKAVKEMKLFRGSTRQGELLRRIFQALGKHSKNFKGLSFSCGSRAPKWKDLSGGVIEQGYAPAHWQIPEPDDVQGIMAVLGAMTGNGVQVTELSIKDTKGGGWSLPIHALAVLLNGNDLYSQISMAVLCSIRRLSLDLWIPKEHLKYRREEIESACGTFFGAVARLPKLEHLKLYVRGLDPEEYMYCYGDNEVRDGERADWDLVANAVSEDRMPHLQRLTLVHLRGPACYVDADGCCGCGLPVSLE